ncbi:MAG: M1 family metallopeptidase [Bacteroidia bacterium]|nr:M1 family metallopeptidase [Bacteroidia bacterium]
MKRIKVLVIVPIILISISAMGQNRGFTHQDTLRGSVTKERAWWDLKYYHLNIAVNPADSTLKGQNTIRYQVTDPYQVMQIDLQEPMKISKVYEDNKQVQFKRDGNAWFIQLSKTQERGDVNEIIVQFEGRPRISRNPPWSGGLSWKRDKNSNPFIVTTCQGDGASIWWPCKDHQADEPDSMLISVTVPENLTDVSNGRLRNEVQNADHTKTFNWFVSNPINNYGVNLNIADYAHFSEKYPGEKGMLDCDYYVLKDNLDLAKTYFQEVKRMLDALEHWFGPYPFYEDSYKLVEVPYPGMEHQSSVTYGNGYKFGYGGRDESRTGWGLKFDFIIIHESAHEWFGNSITSRDIADMWIHESFGAYSETLFVDYHFGRQAGNEYCIGTRKNIGNRTPIIGPYNVNREGSGDMYAKGANMLHTLRQLVDNDEKFRSILRGISKKFYHQTVTTEQIESYLSEATGMDLKLFFDQYLRNTKIPFFEYSVEGKTCKYRWNNCIAGFDMPLKIRINDQEKWVNPATDWKELEVPENAIVSVDPNFYIQKL